MAKIAVLGYGVVGSGTVEVIEKNKEEAVRLIQEHIYIQELTVIKKIQEQEN